MNENFETHSSSTGRRGVASRIVELCDRQENEIRHLDKSEEFNHRVHRESRSEK